ncbi:MAG: DUF4197 domain-containing protein [Geobacteraceae bacterium]|nr:DUF4197 domain-containing protein [Geobacteraceae bacterium]
MKVTIGFTLCILCALASASSAASLSDKSSAVPRRMEVFDDAVTIQGLKEALLLCTEQAVFQAARVDGYYGNPVIKIQMPNNLRQAEVFLRSVGSGLQVDGLVLSMNRAAERAAQQVIPLFGSVIKQMTFDNAGQIAHGDSSAATRFLERKYRQQLFDLYKPRMKAAMDQTGTLQRYNSFLSLCARMPQASQVRSHELDFEGYLTNKALDGIFLLLAESEKRIRLDPAGQTTPTLRKVFGGGR